MTTSPTYKGEPVPPSAIETVRVSVIPPEVFDIFNELIARDWNGSSATVKQDEVISLILSRMNEGLDDEKPGYVTRSDIFSKHWLDVESSYRAVGWKVHYDKPSYYESYPSTFEFSK